MRSKVIELLEHDSFNLNVNLEGNGTLPAYCNHCKGKLDFVRINNKTVLKCRDCNEIVQLDKE